MSCNKIILGGSDSGNASADNTSGPIAAPVASQSGGDQGRCTPNSNTSSSITTPHDEPESTQVTEASNNVRVNLAITTPAPGTSSLKESVGSSGSSTVTMSTSSTATVMSNTGQAGAIGDGNHASKSTPGNNIAAGTSSSATSSSGVGTATTSLLSSSSGPATASSSSSFADYRQIKRKLRSQVDDNLAPSIGNSNQNCKYYIQLRTMQCPIFKVFYDLWSYK